VPFRLRQEAAAAYGSGMKKLLLTLAAATSLAACERAQPEPAVTVEELVVTVAAVPGGMGAGYFTLRTNNEPSKLVRVSSPSVQSIELHETREEGGRTAMAPLGVYGGVFDPSRPLRFAPGGKHAMLIGMDPNLKPGGKILLSFHVEPLREPVTVEAEVRGPGQAHAGH
jgi:copper(I)-binding protein